MRIVSAKVRSEIDEEKRYINFSAFYFCCNGANGVEGNTFFFFFFAFGHFYHQAYESLFSHFQTFVLSVYCLQDFHLGLWHHCCVLVRWARVYIRVQTSWLWGFVMVWTIDMMTTTTMMVRMMIKMMMTLSIIGIVMVVIAIVSIL